MSSPNENESVEHTREAEDDIDVEVEYVPEELSLPLDDPTAKTFSHIFEAFKKISEGVKEHRISHVYKKEEPLDPLTKAAVSEQILQDEMAKKKEREDTIQMSRRKLRLSLQPHIADLKASTSRPDLVEFADVTARDPFLLVQLKTYRNTVPVLKHWNAKASI